MLSLKLSKRNLVFVKPTSIIFLAFPLSTALSLKKIAVGGFVCHLWYLDKRQGFLLFMYLFWLY